MAHLREFARRVSRAEVPDWLQMVASPLVPKEWAIELAGHPDREFRDYILKGISHGFHIGFDYGRYTCRPATSNMGSASKNGEVVQAYLDKEVALGRIVGPIHPSSVPCGTQVSPIGVIPKSNQQGKWRLIVDLSSPGGRSVNGGIEPELCSLHYLRLDEVVQQISKAGQGALLAKMDIDSAYRNVPVHPADRPLLGMQWKGSIFFDTRLPFGLRSAPKIFSAVADALQWSFLRRGVSWVAHYLDDFITVGSPESPECQTNLKIMLATCQRLGVPVAQKSVRAQRQCWYFWGLNLIPIKW